MTSYQKAVSINPHNSLFWAGYASSLQRVKFGSYSDELGHYLLQALGQPTVRPIDVSIPALTALHYHPVISRTLELSKSDHFDEDIDHLTEQLSTVPLLLRIMELSSIADLEIEKMLTKMRKAMLHKAASGGGEALGIPFSAALAMHCFTNEYVFFESKEEKEEIELLQQNVKVILENEDTVSQAWIAVLGAYRPLYSFSWANTLLKTEWSDEIKKVIVRQVDNVREEQALRSKIPRLSSIEDKVSQLVRNQYEENPYPRWINTGLSDKPMTISQVLKSVKLHRNFEEQQFSDNPDILVAGCGTGQHALGTASHFLNCNVLAMDLSLSSLSYAIRKTQELGITNIEYMQGDILKLDQLEREFDIIESVGVLHHMDDPLAGWKVLVGKLRADGLMKIGLYSEIARQSIANARREIAKKEYTSSSDDIRRYREELINKHLNTDSKTPRFIGSGNFYSLSECRDLLFHVQEHRFTLPQIEEALNGLGLKFLGFELQESWIRNEFRKLYPAEDALVSLPLWHQFELKNPAIFSRMYQFWVQKV
jgi:2-polyprenyl-3-methyl-5-hydroxy-6-metoxy-1,4-benzoquinol methylase